MGICMIRLYIYLLSILISLQCAGMQSYAALSLSLSNQNVQHATLVLSDNVPYASTSAAIPDGLSLNASYSNHQVGRQQFASQADRLHYLKTQLQQFPNSRSSVEAQVSAFSTEIKTLVQNFKALVPKPDDATFAIQVRQGLLRLERVIPSDSHLRIFYNEALNEIKAVITDGQGTLKSSLTNAEVRQLNRAIDNLDSQATQWHGTHGEISSVEKVLDQYSSNPLVPVVRQSAVLTDQSVVSRTAFEEVFGDVLTKNNLGELKQMELLCERGAYEKAYELIEKCNCEPHRKMMQETFDKKFDATHTTTGIDKRFLADHRAQELAGTLDISRLPSIHNVELANRLRQEKNILQKCDIQNPSADTRAFTYQIIDRQEMGKAEAIDFVMGSLSRDKTTGNVSYEHFCSARNGLPKHLSYNAEVAGSLFPEKFHTAEYAKDRALLAKVGLIDTKNIHSKMQVERFVRYLQAGCSNTSNSLSSRLFAHELSAQLLGNGDNSLIHLPDFSVSAPAPFQEQLREGILNFTVDSIKSNAFSGERLQSIVSKLGVLYHRAFEGDFKAGMQLEKALNCPEIRDKILAIDLTRIAEIGESGQAFAMRLDVCGKALEDIKKNGLRYQEVNYVVNSGTIDFIRNELKVKLSEYVGPITGNQMYHAVHSGILDGIKLSAHLHQQGTVASQQPVFEVANQSNKLAHSFLKNRDYLSAMNLSAVAHQALEYIQYLQEANKYYGQIYRDGCINFGIGVAEGVQNVGHMVVHPIQTSQQMALGLYNLAILLNRVMDLPNRLLRDPSQALADAQRYGECAYQRARQLGEQIAHTNVNDACRASGRFVTETALMGEMAKVVGMACRAVQAESVVLLTELRTGHATESLVARTAEGIEVKVSQAAENAVFKDSNSLVASSERIASREIVLPKVQTYEQARNKALEIIGEVDVHSGKPQLGKFGVCENQIVGQRWHDKKVVMRLDYDPIKGAHINVTDYRPGKGSNGESICIPFEGSEETVSQLLVHMNTSASLQQAKAIFEKAGDCIDLQKINNTLNRLG